jgi:hypothetical protein
MRAALAPYRFEPFAWSGYVIVIVVEWLREHSIELPRNGMPALRQFLQLSDPLLCAQAAEVEALADRLGSLAPSSDELSRYWVEFTGEDTLEAGQFMMDAWAGSRGLSARAPKPTGASCLRAEPPPGVARAPRGHEAAALVFEPSYWFAKSPSVNRGNVNSLQENLEGQQAASEEVRSELKALVEQCRVALEDRTKEYGD